MGNISVGYNHFSNIGRAQLAGSQSRTTLTEAERKAMIDAQNTARKVLGSGVAGSQAQDANATLGNIEKVSNLVEGDVNAVNLKAAVDLGQQFAQGEVQQALGRVAAPLGAVVSVEALGSKIEAVKKDPNAQNIKGVIATTRDASTAFSVIGTMLVEHSDTVVEVAGRLSDDVAKVMARGLGSSAATTVKAGITGGSKVLGRVATGLSVGVAALDVVIAGSDIKTYWNNPNTKTFAKMGLGIVAAGASVLAATHIPGLSTPATIVAALADVGKASVDVDWGHVVTGAKTSVTGFVSNQVYNMKQEILVSRLPAGAPVSVASSQTPIHDLRNGVIGLALKAS